MSGYVLKEFLVALGFEVDESGYKKFQKGVKNAIRSVAVLEAAVVAAAGAITYAVNQIADQYDALGDLGQRINATVDSIRELGYVATLSGSSVEAVNSSLENLYNNARLAANGMGRGREAFEKLGISVKDANGNLKTTEQLWAEVGEAVKRTAGGEALAMRLGIDRTLIQALTTDTKELRAEYQALMSASGIDSNKATEEAGKFKDAMDRLKFTFKAIGDAVLLSLMPALGQSFDDLRKDLLLMMPAIIAAIKPFLEIIISITKAIARLSARIIEFLKPVIQFFQDLDAATNGWSTAILAAIVAWRALNLAFLATPLGILLSLGLVLVALVDDFLVFKEGGESALSELWQATRAFRNSFVKSLEYIWIFIKGFAKGVAAVLRNIVDSFWFLSDGIVAALRFATEQLVYFLSWLNDVWSAVKGVTQAIGELFSDAEDMDITMSKTITQLPGGISVRPGVLPEQNISQKTEIIVQGASNPETTARMVGAQQSRVNADMARNMRSVAQ